MRERYNLVGSSSGTETKNRKVGPKCKVIQASCTTCSPLCPFYYRSLDNAEVKGPCYALNWPLGQFWRRLSQGEFGVTFRRMVEQVRALEGRWRVRYADVGDLPGRGSAIDMAKLRTLSIALLPHQAWCFTHKPVLGCGGGQSALNREKLAAVKGGGLVINLSAEGWSKPDVLMDLELGPVITVMSRIMVSPDWRKSTTRAGRPIWRCPAEYSDMTCSTCGGKDGPPWCARWDRERIVGFTSHGRHRRTDQRIHEVEMGILGWN
jgi:hypothetical protein